METWSLMLADVLITSFRVTVALDTCVKSTLLIEIFHSFHCEELVEKVLEDLKFELL
jgi:hypothetical protein